MVSLMVLGFILGSMVVVIKVNFVVDYVTGRVSGKRIVRTHKVIPMKEST